LFMGVSSVIQQTFNFIDVKIYYKKQLDYKHKYFNKGWHVERQPTLDRWRRQKGW